MDKTLVLDIETENLGYDIMNDNKRIISVQLNDGSNQNLFYDGSTDSPLTEGKKIIQSKINEGFTFVGFNIRNFDVPFLNKFLDIEIPSEQILDISEMSNLIPIKEKIGKKRPRLVEICDAVGIDCSHKNIMDDSAEQFKNSSKCY
ncbi:hypothetical protein BD31_I0831 [Candidatus Nitrosopumilus salaria BD31]|uniref:YprB ribonuclease H-like domain-containing protein n=1 Tax=Candidatus Nitrosopumilus salarius BD31 TaxID=859350 RepID=I3D231_9ARCH|nr:ribonuclease H-like domain-containing protein [Candidatus Nitrosopumilus salaria]EIJ65774.1 hypothetical protein BD31_I0831 [Candidatus Nitrosopumilus salaria BD31]